ncbi:hypothetical protein DFH07DRAFT_775000 [Mycena maculata]|uniref:CCHC-type domain-containing protein n=1 Tax=Mycena maculata TaxID=230809 RepID=A0AAD7IWA5_9AGAR|nr:hypothetical protein DFH07DRAFT_775000 [Mycena maculata]
MSTPYEISEVCAAAESYFKRDKFSMMLIGADRFGIESMDETSDDDSSEEESSEDESDRERRKRQKKKKLLKRKKRSTSTEALMDTKYDNIKKDVKSEEVEGMIRQLNSMSLDDPSYGATYFKVLSMDTTGIAVKCITRTPRVQTNYAPRPARSYPSEQTAPQTVASPATYPNSVPLNGGAAYSRPPASQTYPRPDTPRSDSCYGCHDKEHRISDCPKLRELIQNGVIKRDEATRRLTWPDGTPIRRFRDESFVSAVERLRPATTHYTRRSSMRNPVRNTHDTPRSHRTRWAQEEYVSDDEWDLDYNDAPQSHFILVANSRLYQRVKGYYSRHAPQRTVSDNEEYSLNFEQSTRHPNSEESDYCTDEEEDNSVYVVPRNGRLEVYPVEKAEKSITANRKAKFDGVHVPGPETRAKLKGRLPVNQETPNSIRPNTRSQGPVKKSIPLPLNTPFKPKASPHIPVEPIPIDAREPRVNPESKLDEMIVDDPANKPSKDKEIKAPFKSVENSEDLRQKVGKDAESKPFGESTHGSQAKKLLDEGVMMGRLVMTVMSILFSILTMKLVIFINTALNKSTDIPAAQKSTCTDNPATVYTLMATQPASTQPSEPINYGARKYPTPEMIHSPGPYNIYTPDDGISFSTLRSEIERQCAAISNGGPTHVRPISITTAQAAYCTPSTDSNGHPTEHIIMPNAVITIFNPLTGLYSVHTSHLIVQGLPLTGRIAGTMPLPLPTEAELRTALVRCQPEQPSLPNVELLLDLYDSHSLFHQCMPKDWETHPADQPYNFRQDRIPPIPGFALGVSNSCIRSPFTLRALQARYPETVSAYLDYRVIPAFDRVKSYLGLQFSTLPDRFIDPYTVAYTGRSPDGIPQLFIPLIDLFLYLLEQSFGYSAVDDTGIYLPQVDRILHELWVHWNYTPVPVNVPHSSEAEVRYGIEFHPENPELILPQRIKFAKELLLADSESDRKNPFLKLLPPLQFDYHPSMSVNWMKNQRSQYSSSEPAESSPSSSDIDLYDSELELQYPESPIAAAESTTQECASGEPSSVVQTDSAVPIRPPLVRLPPFSALEHSLPDKQRVETTADNSMPLSPLPGLELNVLGHPLASRLSPVQEEFAVPTDPPTSASFSPSRAIQPQEPIFLPSEESDADMPELMAVSNSLIQSQIPTMTLTIITALHIPKEAPTALDAPMPTDTSTTVTSAEKPTVTSVSDHAETSIAIADTSIRPSRKILESAGLLSASDVPTSIMLDSGAPLPLMPNSSRIPTPPASVSDFDGSLSELSSTTSSPGDLHKDKAVEESHGTIPTISSTPSKPKAMQKKKSTPRPVKLTRSRYTDFVIDAAKHREDSTTPLHLIGYDPSTNYPIFRTSAGTMVPPPGQPPHLAFLPSNESDSTLARVKVITHSGDLTSDDLNTYLTTPRQAQVNHVPVAVPKAQQVAILHHSHSTVHPEASSFSHQREVQPLPRRKLSRTDTIPIEEFLAHSDKYPTPGAPNIPRDTRKVLNPRHPPSKCLDASIDPRSASGIRRSSAVADLHALSRNPEFYPGSDTSSESEAEASQRIETRMDLDDENQLMDSIYDLEQSHPKVYSMTYSSAETSETQSLPTAPPGITVIPASSSASLAPIRFEVLVDSVSPSGLTRPMTFPKFLDYHKDKPAVMEYLKDPVVYGIINNVLKRGSLPEICVLQQNLLHLRDFRSFRSALVQIVGKIDTLLTRRRLHDPVRRFFRSSTVTEFSNSEIPQFNPTQEGRPIPQTSGNVFFIEEEEAFLTHAIRLLSNDYSFDVCEAIHVLLNIRFPNDSGIRVLVNAGCFEPPEDRSYSIST